MTRRLESDYLRLPPTERLLLAQAIIDSVVAEAQADPLAPEDLAEVDARCADIDAGRVKCVPWGDVRRDFLRGK